MNGSQLDITIPLQELFEEANSKGRLEYIYTLVRVDGLSFGVPDPLLELKAALQNNDTAPLEKELLAQYCSLASKEEPLSLIANLINCVQEKPYNVSPFHHLYTGKFPNIVNPQQSQIARSLSQMAVEAGKPEIAQLVDVAYPDGVLDACSTSGTTSDQEQLRVTFQACHLLLKSLLEIYFAERLKFRDQPRLYKLPQFEVLELLVNDDYGLYGFRVHFSNGSSAIFARHSDKTECTNIRLDVPINFFVGILDDLRNEWRVGEKRLYEIGLHGRYNKLGEWKPIIYPGNCDALQREARSLSEDSDVQGILFYMMCTGHRVIEFVVRTDVELPLKFVSIGQNFHLWKCPPLDASEDMPYPNQSTYIYDGWFELDSVTPESIRNAIASIGVIANMIAFAYGASLKWRVKYNMVTSGNPCATPTEEDLHILDSLLKKFPSTNEAIFLHAAIDWYNHGSSSPNVFTSFLCYYIALESVSIAIADGKADFGLKYLQEDKTKRLQQKKDCIKEKYDKLYSQDPVKFAKEAYLECVLSIKEKTRRVVELIFGSGHSYLNPLFEKGSDGYSLYEIRGKLAHGGITLLDKEDEVLVKSRLYEIANISKEFLIRVILFLKPTDPIPTWSQQQRLLFFTKDPRSILVASKEEIFPNRDWRIRPEWCE